MLLSNFEDNKDFKNILEEDPRIIYNTVTNNENESIYFKDLDSKFILVSKFLAKRFNLTDASQAYNKTDFDFFASNHAKQAFQDEQEIISTKKSRIGFIEKETWGNGRVSYVISSKFPLLDTLGKVIGIWGHSIDITDLHNLNLEIDKENQILQELNDNLLKASYKDSLTGLFNVKHFYEEMEFTLNQFINLGMENRFTILFLDVDNFKKINDNYGHLAGDAALVFTGDILIRNVRYFDKVFRYGGDEFAVIFKNADTDIANDISMRIVEELNRNIFVYEGQRILITLSGGICDVCEFDATVKLNEMVSVADKRLYFSKDNGKNLISKS